jgi:hypothetical protein
MKFNHILARYFFFIHSVFYQDKAILHISQAEDSGKKDIHHY